MAGLNRLKDIDPVSRARFLRIYFWLLSPLLFLMLFAPVDLPAKILISLLGALIGTVVTLVVINFKG